MRSSAMFPSFGTRLLFRFRFQSYYLVNRFLNRLRVLLLVLTASLLLLAVILISAVPRRLDRSFCSSSNRPISPEIAILIAFHVVEQSFCALRPLRHLVANPPASVAICAIEKRVCGRVIIGFLGARRIRQVRMATGHRAAIHALWYLWSTSLGHRCLAECMISATLDAVCLAVLATCLMSSLPRVSSVSDSIQCCCV